MKHILLASTIFISCNIFSQGKFDGGDGDGFATTIITNIVLPLQVVDFTVANNNGSTTAQLRIVSNEEICSLQLQRSNDGSSFSTVDEKQSSSPGLQGDVFLFNDVQATGGNVFYRVKITRCDGTYLFSKTVVLQSGKKERWIVAGKNVSYQIAVTGQVQCYSQSGQLIYSRQLYAGSGEISLPVVAAGIYMIRFNNETKGRYWINSN